MPQARVGSLTLEYDRFGAQSDPAVLLVMGIGSQMILWPVSFCRALVDRGFQVIRFDNRDVGLSTKLDDLGIPDLGALMAAVATGTPPKAAYILSDMAKDAVGLLDALGIAKAHVVGASMGGMIAQMMAVEHPGRLLSLTSIMSSTGDPGLPAAKPEAMGALLTPAPDTERETLIKRFMDTFTVIGSPGYPPAPGELRRVAEQVVDRGQSPAGFLRQLAAILASPPRTPLLASVKISTLVLHGEDDPLVPVECGIATAKAIQGARLVTVPGMGHDFTEALMTVFNRELGGFLREVQFPGR
jgi:pimeloyl-ACP methyl ester carboxylesterase